MDKSSKSTGIVVAILALLIGGGAGYALGMNNDDNSSVNSSTSQKSDSAMSKDAGDGVTVGGAKMVANLDIVDNAANASNVTTVVSLVKAAGLVETLKGTGPFTVFGPNNDAFAKLPPETVAAVQKPENVELLKTILTYHVVSGTYTSADLRAMAAKGETLTSVQGGVLTPIVENNKVKIKDAKGSIVSIETADIVSSNGITHVIDTVMMPQ